MFLALRDLDLNDGLQRMQTAPKGTYRGMVDCAGGILKNEGPLAFYKVRGRLLAEAI